MIRKSVLLAALALMACEGGDDEERYQATLSGSAEVPPQTTNATGTARFTVDGAELDYTLNVQNITGAIAAHIHPGAPGENKSPIVFLFSQAAPGATVSAGSLAAGSVNASNMIATAGVSYDSMLSLIRRGNAYVNVHTVAKPGGEIRGQIVAD
jgi:hypothetical protein